MHKIDFNIESLNLASVSITYQRKISSQSYRRYLHYLPPPPSSFSYIISSLLFSYSYYFNSLHSFHSSHLISSHSTSKSLSKFQYLSQVSLIISSPLHASYMASFFHSTARFYVVIDTITITDAARVARESERVGSEVRLLC